MDALGSKQQVNRVFTSRKQATAEAKAIIMKSDIQAQLGEKTGGFVWHVEKWPHWLQVCVDVVGNDESTEKAAREGTERWDKMHGANVKEMFSELLGTEFGDIYINAKPMGKERHMGGCCRTGCGGCMNGPHEKLLPKLQEPGSLATNQCDRLG